MKKLVVLASSARFAISYSVCKIRQIHFVRYETSTKEPPLDIKYNETGQICTFYWMARLPQSRPDYRRKIITTPWCAALPAILQQSRAKRFPLRNLQTYKVLANTSILRSGVLAFRASNSCSPFSLENIRNSNCDSSKRTHDVCAKKKTSFQFLRFRYS